MVEVDRRVGLLFAASLLLLAAAGLRALWLVGVDGHSLRSRAAAQQVQVLHAPARRGTITDRNGVELAVSEDSATVFANPRLVRNPADAAARLAPAIGRPVDALLRILSDSRRGFVYLARQIDPSRGDAIRKLKIPGIDVTTEPRRRYPHGSLASQLIGAVGTDGYGLAGIEQSRERVLHGRDGTRRVVSDAIGQPVSIVDVKPSTPGHDIRLTIDSAIQQQVEGVLHGVGQSFHPRGATALVMNPRNGEILALANWPPVDAQHFGNSPAYARQNRAVGASYEPGSTFKAITVSGALEERLVTPVQMAAAYDAIANGGVAHRPYAIAGDGTPGRRVIDAGTAHTVAHMLEGVLGPRGTAPEAKIPGYILAGKTGTAQKADAGGYSSSKYFSSFIGFAPARNPRLLVAVMVDEPQSAIYGGVVAAPAFQKIASFVLPYMRIPPG